MVKVELDGKVMELETDDGVEILDLYQTVEKHLSAEELLKKIPLLVSLGITADEIASGIEPENKTWLVYRMLLENGLGIHQTMVWYDNPHEGTAQDLHWVFGKLLQKNSNPDNLAVTLNHFLAKEMLDSEDNVKILLEYGVSAGVLVSRVMTDRQIIENMGLLLKNGANVNDVIERLGCCPDFYKRYSIESVIKAGADPIRVSKYVFYPTQPFDESKKYLEDLYKNGLHLGDFVKNIVVGEKISLHVMVEFAQFFVESYVDVEAVFENIGVFDDDATERIIEDRLTILANFSELAELGIIKNSRKTLRKWRKGIGISTFEQTFDSHGYEHY